MSFKKKFLSRILPLGKIYSAMAAYMARILHFSFLSRPAAMLLVACLTLAVAPTEIVFADGGYRAEPYPNKSAMACMVFVKQLNRRGRIGDSPPPPPECRPWHSDDAAFPNGAPAGIMPPAPSLPPLGGAYALPHACGRRIEAPAGVGRACRSQNACSKGQAKEKPVGPCDGLDINRMVVGSYSYLFPLMLFNLFALKKEVIPNA